MAQVERDSLKVDVPVGFMLAEPREVIVSIERPAAEPLSIRLRLIPAAADRPDFGGEPPRCPDATPSPSRRLRALRAAELEPELGGSD